MSNIVVRTIGTSVDWLINYTLKVYYYLMAKARRIRTGIKVGLLVFFSSFDKVMEKTHRRIEKHSKSIASTARKQKFSIISYLIDDRQSLNWFNNDPDIVRLLPYFRAYRHISTFIHFGVMAKYIMFLLMTRWRLIPVEYNCYMPGRLIVFPVLMEYNIVIGFFLSTLNLIWRLITLWPKKELKIQLDVFLFIMQQVQGVGPMSNHRKQSITQREIRNNSVTKKMKSDSISRAYHKLLMKRCLFYKINYQNNLTAYRLRPNRTNEARKKSLNRLDQMMLFLTVSLMSCGMFVLPGLIQSAPLDIYTIKNYPTCCPRLEAVAAMGGQLTADRISFDKCQFRNIMLIFDTIESFYLSFDTALTCYPTFCVAVLICSDLMIYWHSIEQRIEALKPKLARTGAKTLMAEESRATVQVKNRISTGSSSDWWTAPGSTQYCAPVMQVAPINHQDVLEHSYSRTELIELQAILGDFFNCTGHVNRFMSIALSFSIFLFYYTVFIVAYLSVSLADFWQSLMARATVLSFFLILAIDSALALRVKHAIDGAYVSLSSIMAFDETDGKLKWPIILENYTFRGRNTFKIFGGVIFSWPVVINTLASTVSFLAIVETYKRQLG